MIYREYDTAQSLVDVSPLSVWCFIRDRTQTAWETCHGIKKLHWNSLVLNVQKSNK